MSSTSAVAPSLQHSLALGPSVTVRWETEPCRSTLLLLEILEGSSELRVETCRARATLNTCCPSRKFDSATDLYNSCNLFMLQLAGNMQATQEPGCGVRAMITVTRQASAKVSTCVCHRIVLEACSLSYHNTRWMRISSWRTLGSPRCTGVKMSGSSHWLSIDGKHGSFIWICSCAVFDHVPSLY